MQVFVLDRKGKPPVPCAPRRAHRWLDSGRARRHEHPPSAIRLVDITHAASIGQPLRLKRDPVSQITGITAARETESTQVVVALRKQGHRGQLICKKMMAQSQMRRARKSRKTRFGQPRFNNRGHSNQKTGWLAPSLMHRVDTTMAWVRRSSNLSSIVAILVELVRLGMQQMARAQFAGVQDTPLKIDLIDLIGLIEPRAPGGSDRAWNRALVRHGCNRSKGAQTVEGYLQHKFAPLQRSRTHCTAPLGDAAAVNGTRLRLARELKRTDLPAHTSTGGRTRYNRRRLQIPKTHASGTVCVGHAAAIANWQQAAPIIVCSSRGSHQRTWPNQYGLPRGYLRRHKQLGGCQTGDLVRAVVADGLKAGICQGRVAIQKTGSLNVQAQHSVVQNISWRSCRLLQRGDGSSYISPDGSDGQGTDNMKAGALMRRRQTGFARGPYLPALEGQVSWAVS